MNKLLLIVFILLSLSYSLRANHIIGGSITYECLGPDPDNPGNQLYAFTMLQYRDCLCVNCAFFDGVFDEITPRNNPCFVTVRREGEPLPIEVLSLFIHRSTIEQIDPAESADPCVILPPDVCIQEAKYEFTYSFPVIDESYYIIYQRCCRNQGVTNLINSAEQGSTFFVELTPAAQQACNSTPSFDEYPPALLCVNEAFSYNASATDQDGDQLVYSLCAPVKGGNRNVVKPFISGPPPYQEVDYFVPFYTPSQPLGGDPAVTIDAITGIISGTPNTLGEFVVGICVQEFRNGTLLSTVRRDFQFRVTTCEEVVSANVDATLKNGAFYYHVCNGDILEIDNTSRGNTAAIIAYAWSIAPADSNASLLSFDTRDIDLPVLPIGINTGRLVVYPDTGVCNDTIDFIIEVTPDMLPDFSFEYDTCIAGPVRFTDRSDTLGNPTAIRRWRFGDSIGVTQDELNPSYRYQDAGQYTTELFLQDTFGCEFSATKTFNWQPAPPILIIKPDRFRGCPPLTNSFVNLSSPIDENYEVFWEFGDNATSTDINPTHIYKEEGLYSVSLEVISPIGCQIDTVFQRLIRIYPPPKADFDIVQDLVTSLSPTVEFIDRSSSNTRFWKWDIDGEETIYEQNPSYTFQDTGLQQITLEVATSRFCYDTIVKFVDVIPQSRFFLPNAFTPNADNRNDVFEPVGIFLGIHDYRMTIWDRWGAAVYDSEDIYAGWNGRRNNTGRLANNGVYTYQISYTEGRGQQQLLEGVVTLIR